MKPRQDEWPALDSCCVRAEEVRGAKRMRRCRLRPYGPLDQAAAPDRIQRRPLLVF
jgi:hypothetical protein